MMTPDEINLFCDELRKKMFAEADTVAFEMKRGVHRKPNDAGWTITESNGSMTVSVMFNGGARDTEQHFSDGVNKFLASEKARIIAESLP